MPLLVALGVLGVAGWVSGTFEDMDWTVDNTQSTKDSGPPVGPILEDRKIFPKSEILPDLKDEELLAAGIVVFALLLWAAK